MKDTIIQVKLSELKTHLDKIPASKRFYVVDKAILEVYKNELQITGKENIFVLDNPESDKNIAKYEECLNHFIEKNIRRDSTIVAIGGGATIDFAGFVAATTLRGINWHVVPTTLLAMLDACIGGKVALNTSYGKNLIGAFHKANNVYICHEFLKSLPKPEVDSGMGELIKYAFISSEINKAIKKSIPMEDLILKCLKYKKEVTDKDFREENDRRILNFGHTLGHAYEKDLNLPHGIAVILGIYHTIKSFHHELLTELYGLMDILNIDKNILYTRPSNMEKFWSYVAKDKKIVEDSVDYILLKSLGHPTINKMLIAELKEKVQF
ncbi:MAG: 3-dehydroquinate synthase [Bacteriovoracaceae bacterium]|nr:3-dehydroquinate synthase [Bacteriovoracaceae bacterium]